MSSFNSGHLTPSKGLVENDLTCLKWEYINTYTYALLLRDLRYTYSTHCGLQQRLCIKISNFPLLINSQLALTCESCFYSDSHWSFPRFLWSSFMCPTLLSTHTCPGKWLCCFGVLLLFPEILEPISTNFFKKSVYEQSLFLFPQIVE